MLIIRPYKIINKLTQSCHLPVDDVFVWKKKQEEVGLDKLDEGDRELFAQLKEKEKKIELWKVSCSYKKDI